MNSKCLLISVLAINLLFSSGSLCFAQSKEAIQFYNQGVGYHNQGKTNLAIQSYKKALSLNPNFKLAKENLISLYFNQGVEYSRAKQWNLAVQNYQKVIQLDPKNIDVYYNLGIVYSNAKQYDKAIQSYRKVLASKPNMEDARHNLYVAYYNYALDSMNNGNTDKAIENYKSAVALQPDDTETLAALGNAYHEKGDFNSAIQAYKKALEIKPDSYEIKNNLEVTYAKMQEIENTTRINDVKAYQKAPQDLYGLIRFHHRIKNETIDRTYEILDLIWCDHEGRKLLEVVRSKRIPINITPGGDETNATVRSEKYQQSIALFGIIPIYTYEVGSRKDVTINIGEDHIRAFRDTNLPTKTRLYAFQVPVHEFCHAVKNALFKDDNSLQEELSASLIGYNIASRTINKRDLIQKEAYELAKGCLQALLTDDHRLLPINNSFNEDMQKFGIYPPHLYTYQNVVELYRVISDDPQTQKLHTLERML